MKKTYRLAFPIVYMWADAEGEYQGSTVWCGKDAESALANFQQRNPHLKDSWIAGTRTPVKQEVAA